MGLIEARCAYRSARNTRIDFLDGVFAKVTWRVGDEPRASGVSEVAGIDLRDMSTRVDRYERHVASAWHW